MKKRDSRKAMFSSSPVLFKDSAIEGRGVFARRHFEPGELIVPYAPKQRRVSVDDAEASLAAKTKLTLLSEGAWVIIPDQSVPGGWLCNHSCSPNAAIYSDGEGRIEATRPIAPGSEVTIFYGWITENDPKRDPCRCGAKRCRGYINFDLTSDDAAHFDDETDAGRAFRRRVDEYGEYLVSIGQEQVLDLIADKISLMRSREPRA